jgi:hypothetical protein
MPVKVGPIAPKASARAQELREDAKGLTNAAVELGTAATSHAKSAQVEATTAAILSVSTLERATDAVLHVMGSSLENVVATVSVASAAVTRMAEVGLDLLGAALQQVGRAFVVMGNWLRGRHNPQVIVEAVEGKASGASLSDRLLSGAGEHYQLAAAQMTAAINDIVAGKRDMVGAAKVLASAATEISLAAAKGGAAGVLAVSAGAVTATAAAVDAAERGLDGSGALLQKAGGAVVDAGNELMTARATQTNVQPTSTGE